MKQAFALMPAVRLQPAGRCFLSKTFAVPFLKARPAESTPSGVLRSADPAGRSGLPKTPVLAEIVWKLWWLSRMATQCSRGLYFLLTSAHCYAAKAARAPQLSTGKLFLQGGVSVSKRCDSTGILFFCSASGVVPRVGGTDQPADPSIWRYAAISEGQAFHYQFCYLLTCRNQCIANAVLTQHLQILNSIQHRAHPCHRR